MRNQKIRKMLSTRLEELKERDDWPFLLFVSNATQRRNVVSHFRKGVTSGCAFRELACSGNLMKGWDPTKRGFWPSISANQLCDTFQSIFFFRSDSFLHS